MKRHVSLQILVQFNEMMAVMKIMAQGMYISKFKIYFFFQIDHQLCNNPGSNLPVNLQTAGHLDHTGMPTAPSLGKQY